MRIAFHAPLKSPGHPVPSGDRAMARLLIRALELGGHDVEVVSELRPYRATPDEDFYRSLYAEADAEVSRLGVTFAHRPPDCFLCYHPYYKAPDLIGPRLARTFDIPYVTVEASWSKRRGVGVWADTQGRVLAGIRQAAVNICLTGRDRDGLLEGCPDARVDILPPFIDAAPFVLSQDARGGPGKRLATVAMMRAGDKLDSYRLLADALARLTDLDWSLDIVGDGPERNVVAALFAGMSAGRIHWRGELPREAVAQVLAASDLYVWPGSGEAYGLAYLEAQAAGLPVVAQDVAGVPEVVRNGATGLLTPAGDVAAYADAIRALLSAPDERARMGAAARRFVTGERTLEAASARLNGILERWLVAA